MSGLEISQAKNFHVMRWSFSLIIFAAIAIYAYTGVRWYNTGELSPLPMPVSAADTSIDETPVTDSEKSQYKVAATQPRSIEISKLGVHNARIEKIGLTERNMLDVPRHLDDAGWYAKSSTPGSGMGAVLLNGHSSGASRGGLFAKLSTLKKDDQISVERGDGKVFTYEVVDVREMPLDQVNKTGMKEMMYSADSRKEGLSIITNSGKWIPKDKVFDSRILVRATIVE